MWEKKKIIRISVIVVTAIGITGYVALYNVSGDFRNFMDVYILNKEIVQNDAKTLKISNLSKDEVVAYNNLIGILKNNQFEIYNSNLERTELLEIKITNLISSAKGKYIVLAEQNGQKVYLIKDKQILWEQEVEGEITDVYVNENGYVALTIIGTSHKTIVTMIDLEGKKIFNSYLSKTLVTDVSISNSNKHLAFAEIDTTGAIIQSKIKAVSVDKIIENAQDSVETLLEAESNLLITNIEYTDTNEIICMYTDKIVSLNSEGEKVIFDCSDKNIVHQSVDINNAAVVLEEQATGLFTANTMIKIIDGKSGNQKEYEIDGVTKQMKTAGNIVAAVTSKTVELVDTRGWLVKRYIANQEIIDIVLSESVAGIIYKDRIELIKF